MPARISPLRRSLLAAIALGAARAFAQPPPKDAPAVEWKLTVVAGGAFPTGRAAMRWAQIANDALAGVATVKVHPGATLAQRDPLREFVALKDGGADFGVGSALAWSAQVPALAVYALPWLAPTPRAIETLAGDPATTAIVAARVEAAGAVLLAIAPLGHEALSTTRGPLMTPADVAGLRVRASPSPLVVETLAALAMQPATMAFAQAQSALLDGSLDGELGTPASFAAMRIAALGQKQLLRWGAFADAMIFAASATRWGALTDDQRQLLRSAAQTAAAESNALVREDDAVAELARTGVTSTRLTSAQRAPFRDAVKSVVDRWSGVVGDDVLRAAKAALAALPDTER